MGSAYLDSVLRPLATSVPQILAQHTWVILLPQGSSIPRPGSIEPSSSRCNPLNWVNLQARDDGGQVTIFGKGGKTRAVLLSAALWDELHALRGVSGADAPVFRSRKGGGHLDPSQVERIVLAAAKRARLSEQVSPHWLRHAHASHALDGGAPIHLVAATLGHASIATTGAYAHTRPSDSSSRYLAV